MRARHYLSLLVIAGALITVFSVTSSSAAPLPAAQPASTWKSEPEDPRPWPREPFKKIEGPKSAAQLKGLPGGAQDLILQGIMKVDSHFYAIINGRTVKKGDRIDEWTIANISRHRVTVRQDKEQQTYDIYQGRIDRGTQ
jgi:hypothetical protein